MQQVRQLPAYALTAVELRRFLRSPLTPLAAERFVGDALSLRRGRLLALLQHRVYDCQNSPYRQLLHHAGLTYPEAKELIDREGVDGALATLAAQGVYVSLDEFRGRRPIQRGSLTIPSVSGAFDMARTQGGVQARSGATRSTGTATLIRFDSLVEEAAHRSLMLKAVGHDHGSVALWLQILPGSAGIANILRYAKFDRAPEQWFSHAPVSLDSANHAAWQTHAIVRLGRFFGTPLPTPEHVPLPEADRIAAWMIDRLRQGERCHLVTYVSSAVRVCAAATAAGAGLNGALFVVIGEPLTLSRWATIRATGAEVTCTYSMAETGTLGCGCGDPAAPDDVHLLADRTAVVRHSMDARGRDVDGLLLTSLSPHARKVMLNVEAGDTAQLSERTCACPYGKLGYTQHLHAITSYEKFTGEGMTYDASALVRVIEEVLPARFGGAPTDYQVIEEEDEDKLVRLTVLVSPRVGDVDEAEIIATLRGEMQRGPAGHRLAALIWNQAGFLRVRCAEPIPTARAKLFPFQISRPSVGD